MKALRSIAHWLGPSSPLGTGVAGIITGLLLSAILMGVIFLAV